MKKLLILFIIPLLNFGQEIQYSKPNYYDVPIAQNHKNVIDIFTWYDTLGKNTLILTAKKSSGVKVDFRAYHYTGDGNLLWDIKDYSGINQGDEYSGINHEKITITDLDDDGIAEISIFYNLGWNHNDDASGVKLIMHEKGKKYAIRGKIWWDNDNECSYNYNMYGKNSFEPAKSSFQDYARGLFLEEMENSFPCVDLIKEGKY